MGYSAHFHLPCLSSSSFLLSCWCSAKLSLSLPPTLPVSVHSHRYRSQLHCFSATGVAPHTRNAYVLGVHTRLHIPNVVPRQMPLRSSQRRVFTFQYPCLGAFESRRRRPRRRLSCREGPCRCVGVPVPREWRRSPCSPPFKGRAKRSPGRSRPRAAAEGRPARFAGFPMAAFRRSRMAFRWRRSDAVVFILGQRYFWTLMPSEWLYVMPLDRDAFWNLMSQF